MLVKRVTFVIKSENQAGVLARVVLLFHRLNVPIEALWMARTRGHKTMCMRVTVDADEDHARRMEAHLSKVVEVRSVETRAQRSKGKR
jgi:acetolactate synthase small subunit